MGRPATSARAFVHVPTREEVVHLLSVRTLLSRIRPASRQTRKHPNTSRSPQDLRDGENAVEADDEEALVAANTALHRVHGFHLRQHRPGRNDRLRGTACPAGLHTPARMRRNHTWVEHAEIIDAITNFMTRVEPSRRCGRHADQTRRGYLQIVRNGEEQVRH